MTTKPVFISYSSANIAQANQLKGDLQKRNIPVWIDADNLKPGDPNWAETIEKGIPNCQAVIYLASPEAKASKYVLHELKLAEHHNIPVIPFWIIGADWLDVAPLGMAMAQYIDARDDYSNALQQLLKLLSSEPVAISGQWIQRETKLAVGEWKLHLVRVDSGTISGTAERNHISEPDEPSQGTLYYQVRGTIQEQNIKLFFLTDYGRMFSIEHFLDLDLINGILKGTIGNSPGNLNSPGGLVGDPIEFEGI